jgi:hypothetical protein
MSISQRISLYYNILALKEEDFNVVYRMIHGLADDFIEIERLSPEEAAPYKQGFDEMRNGECVTLEQFLKDELEKDENFI